jgi:hypothetical protein
MVEDGKMPKPKRTYGRTIWDKLAVDRAFDLLDGGTERDESGEEIWAFSNEPAAVPNGGTDSKKTSIDNAHKLRAHDDAIGWAKLYRDSQKEMVVSMPLGRLERIALAGLAIQTGPVEVKQLAKGCGYASAKRLVWRGFVEQVGRNRHRGTTFEITSAGRTALEQVENLIDN